MTRHLNLGDNLYITLCCIGNHLANLILSVEATIGCAIPLYGVKTMTYEGLLTHSTLLSKLGVCLNLDTPTLIVGEVPVQAVELVCGEDVDVVLHVSHREEVARYIEVSTTICKGGLVSDKTVGDVAVVRYDDLTQGLQAIVYASLCATDDDDTLLADGHLVALGGNELVDTDVDAITTLCALNSMHRLLESEVRHHILGKALCGIP